MSTEFNHVELSRPALTSADIPANQKSAPRSPRADALFCNSDTRMYTLACLYFFAWRNICWNTSLAAVQTWDASTDVCIQRHGKKYKSSFNCIVVLYYACRPASSYVLWPRAHFINDFSIVRQIQCKMYSALIQVVVKCCHVICQILQQYDSPQ